LRILPVLQQLGDAYGFQLILIAVQWLEIPVTNRFL